MTETNCDTSDQNLARNLTVKPVKVRVLISSSVTDEIVCRLFKKGMDKVETCAKGRGAIYKRI